MDRTNIISFNRSSTRSPPPDFRLRISRNLSARSSPNTRTLTILMDEVQSIDLAKKRWCSGNKASLRLFDYRPGSVTGYFGHSEWEQFAPGLKTLDDAFRIRRNILLAFEKAETAKTRGTQAVDEYRGRGRRPHRGRN